MEDFVLPTSAELRREHEARRTWYVVRMTRMRSRPMSAGRRAQARVVAFHDSATGYGRLIRRATTGTNHLETSALNNENRGKNLPLQRYSVDKVCTALGDPSARNGAAHNSAASHKRHHIHASFLDLLPSELLQQSSSSSSNLVQG